MNSGIFLSLVAGLFTAVGALLVSSEKIKKLDSLALSFATGILISISLLEMLPDALESLNTLVALIWFMLGIIFSLVLDFVFPHSHGHGEEEPGHFISECDCSHSDHLSRSMILALSLHNLIEGMVTGITATTNIRLGWSLALGIALHNIPIGLTLAISIVSTGRSKLKAVLFSIIIGLVQVLGAVIGILILKPFKEINILPVLMSITSGILIYISFNELWPAAKESKNRKLIILVMSLGLIFIPALELI